MGEMKIHKAGHYNDTRPTVSGVKRREDGTRYRELDFPEMVITGTLPQDYLTGLAKEGRPLEVVICIDSTDRMRSSPFMILAQIKRLEELCKREGLKLNIEIVHFHDGEEFIQIPMTEVNSEGLAKVVDAVLTIPFGNNYGGSTTGDVVADTLKRRPKDDGKKGQAIIVFTNSPELTTAEVEQIGLARDNGVMVVVTDNIMGFLPDDTGHLMSRPESVKNVAELLKRYGEYKGNAELAKRFETEKGFLLKLAYAIALDNSDKTNSVDTGFSIIWDPRFRCSSDADVPMLCLDPYAEFEPQGDELFVSGLYRFWAGTENYYSYIYQAALEAKDEETFTRSMSILTYDILKTAIKKQRGWENENIQGLEGSNVADPAFMLDYFNIDPFTLLYTIKNFKAKAGSETADLLGYLFNNCDDYYAFELWYKDAPVRDKLPIGLYTGTPEVKELKNKLGAHIRHQFESHDEVWRFEQLDKIVKFCDIRINIFSIKDVELLIFLAENVPGFKETAMVDGKVREFLDYCLEKVREGKPLTTTDENRRDVHDIENIYAMLITAGLVSDERVAEMNEAFIEDGGRTKYPNNKGYLAFMLKIAVEPGSRALNMLVESLSSGRAAKMSLLDVLSFMQRMTPKQRQRVFEVMPDGGKEWLLNFQTEVFFELCSQLEREYAIELISDIIEDADEPLELIDKVFVTASSPSAGAAGLAREVLKSVQGLGWGGNERLMFEVAETLLNGDGKKAVDIIFGQMVPEAEEDYRWWQKNDPDWPGWNWISDVDKMSFGGNEGLSKLEQVHRNRQYPLTWVGRWLVLGKYDGVAEAMAHYLIDGNENQREMARDLLLTSNYVDDDQASGAVIERLRATCANYDQFFVDYLFNRSWKTKNCEKFLVELAGILAGYFDPDILFDQKAPVLDRARQDQIWKTLYNSILEGHWDELSKEERLELFSKIQKVIIESFRAHREHVEIMGLIYSLTNLNPPVGKDRETDDTFLTDRLIPAIAEWMAEARIGMYRMDFAIGNFLDDLGITPAEYVIMMDTGYSRYFGDINRRTFLNIVLSQFRDNYSAEFLDYIVDTLKSDAHGETFKDMIFGAYFGYIESLSKTEVKREKTYNKETGSVDERINVAYECQDEKNEWCNRLLGKMGGVYRLVADTEIPLKYRTKAMKQLYYFMIKFDPKLIKIDFEGLCNSLIADPNTQELGEYYLKKWQATFQK